MAVEAVVALKVVKLDELVRKDAQLLGMHGEINRIREELNKMRRFLKDADIKQKEDEAVRDWIEDIRDICFDVDVVIDILGKGQAAQGRHGFVERLKRCISDQITRYKASKEIERIKLSIKDISRSRESYGIREINEEKQEATSSTQRLQEDNRCFVPPKEIEIVIDEGRLELYRVSQQLIKEEPSPCDGTRDIDEGRQEENLLCSLEQDTEAGEAMTRYLEDLKEKEAKRGFLEDIINSAPRLQEVDQLTNEERTRDIDVGRQEASSSSRNLQAHRPVSTLPGEPEEVGLQEETNGVGQQLIEEEPRLWDGTRDISEGKLEASSSTPGLKADGVFSTLLGDSEDVGLQEGINTVDQQLIKEEPGPYDGTRDFDEGRLEESPSDPSFLADSWLFNLHQESEEEIDTVSEQLIKEEPSHCDDKSDIDEGPECRDGSKNRKMQPKWSEQILASSKPSLEGPPDDGCSWRKYAQKETLGAKHPRAYYHRNVQVCAATKHVQRPEEDPSIFQKRQIAEGFIAQRDGELMEDVAKDCFKKLLSKSLFNGTRSSSTSVRRPAFLGNVDGYETSKSSTESLRSILYFSDSEVPLSKLLNTRPKLPRVLERAFVDFSNVTLPKDIGVFAYLRCLEIGNSPSHCVPLPLPPSIGNLSNLQTLHVRGSATLPNEISNLKQPRHLQAFWNDIDGHPQLENLRNLCPSYIRAGSWMEDGLDKLTNLGVLKISGPLSSYLEAPPDPIPRLEKLIVNPVVAVDSCPTFMPFTHLYGMFVLGRIGKLPELPLNLAKLTLYGSKLQQDAISTLEKLSNLEILQLCFESYISKQMICSSGGFPRLKLLILTQLSIEELIVEEGAMPVIKSVELHRLSKLSTTILPNRVHVLVKWSA